MKIVKGIWVGILLIVIAGTTGYMIFHSDTGPSTARPATPETKTYSDVEAYVQAQEILRGYLKSPATAKFPSMSEASIEHLGDTGFKVSSYVDAENSFGALLRSDWITIFQFVGDKVQISLVALDGKILYKADSVKTN